MKRAAVIPLETLRASEKVIFMAKEAVERGNPNTLTDGGAAGQIARATAAIASYNVRINLSGIEDKTFVTECNKEVEETLQRVEVLFAEMDEYVRARLL